MSKANDDARITGSHEADRAEPGGLEMTGSTTSGSSDEGVDRATADSGARRSRRAAEAPVDAVPEPQGERASRTRARGRRRQGVPVAGGTPGRTEGVDADAPDGRRSGDPSVEEALTARNAIAEEAREHVAGLQAGGTDDPFTVDPEVLAQQKDLAERAAALNSRARRTQDVSGRDQQRKPASNDPAAAHNLSIVTPPEFVRVPGGSRSVLRAPSTSHIPVVLPRPVQPAAPGPAPTATAPAAAAPPAPVEGGGRTVDAHPVPQLDPDATEPIRARSAFGLEPLDAMTAGLGRLRRVRHLQYSLLGAGAVALATGIVLTVSSLNG